MLQIHKQYKQENLEYLRILCKFILNYIYIYIYSNLILKKLSEPPKPPPRPTTRPVATDTSSLITHKDTACGPNEPTQNHDISTDTLSLISLHDRASGLDIPPELLSRHVSTDTRTLISIRDNFSTTTPLIQAVHIDAQTQSTPTIQNDASSNTLAPAEQRHTGVQVSDMINKIMILSLFFLGRRRTTYC